MRIRLILTFLLFCILQNAKAQDAFTHMTLHFNNDEQIKFALAEIPTLSFSDSTLVIQTSSITVTHPLNKISHITYESGADSGIINIQSDKPIYEIDGDHISFPYLEKGTHIDIYTVQGTNVLNTQIQESGEYGFPVSALGRGIYIVKLNNLSFKIVIK